VNLFFYVRVIDFAKQYIVCYLFFYDDFIFITFCLNIPMLKLIMIRFNPKFNISYNLIVMYIRFLLYDIYHFLFYNLWMH